MPFKRALIVSVLIASLFVTNSVFASDGGGSWPSAGLNLHNTRYQASERELGVSNVASLGVKWQFTTGGDVSATPAVEGSRLYVPDWAGNLFAIDRRTGAQIWSRRIADYTGVAGDVVRVTPAIAGNMLIFGDQGGSRQAGARVMAVNKRTGDLIWVRVVDDHFSALVTQSAVVDDADDDDAVVYVGVSSNESAFAGIIPGYQCCTFRGSVVALQARTGRILWQTYTVPVGYSGGAVWGGTPVVDHERNSLYVTSGNNYAVPEADRQCALAAGTDADAVRACISRDNHFDSIIALSLRSGRIKWAHAALPADAWNASCLPGFANPENCPNPTGPDYDLSQGTALFTVRGSGRDRDGPRELLGAGQKSGQYWAVDPDTGEVVWVTQVGPGGIAGGLQWGSATDGRRIYTAVANSNGRPWQLPDGRTVTSGLWSALDAATGRILWQTPDPLGALDQGAVSAANGVMYACSLDPQGHMYALNAATGAILWSFASGGSCNGGAAVVDGTIYWGSGYNRFGFGTGNNKVYAFDLSR